ncbi:MAG TPA: hypothetical protein VMU93_00105 [Caulobacteraceae bacterium]|nr:hypothetical protein [Caulobacteraceae bacterium]
MNLRRLLFVLGAISALAVSAGVCVVAAAFALFAVLSPEVGTAGAAALVCLAGALLIGVIGLALMGLGRGRARRRKGAEPQRLVERAVEFLREQPVLAIAGALAAGLLAVRNPKYLGAAIRAFVEGRNPPAR